MGLCRCHVSSPFPNASPHEEFIDGDEGQPTKIARQQASPMQAGR